ncbi:MAG: hypothetical protein ACYSTL_03555 [Planctomycetota bacterium]
MLLGSHLSIAGGLHNALEKAHEYGFECLGVFVHNQIQWRAASLGEEAVETFCRRRPRAPDERGRDWDEVNARNVRKLAQWK